MPGRTVTIILDKVFNKSVPRPVNLRPGYDLDYVINYYVKMGCYGNWIVKMFELEKEYDDLSIIRPHETPQQWANRIRVPLQKILSRREYSVYHVYSLFASFGQGVPMSYCDPLTYRRPSVHKSQMAICFDCWKLVKITEAKPRKEYYSGWGRWGYEIKSEDLMKQHWDCLCSKANTKDELPTEKKDWIDEHWDSVRKNAKKDWIDEYWDSV